MGTCVLTRHRPAGHQSARIVCFCWQVNELQRRQRKEHEKEVKRREKLQEKEKTERATQAKLKMEEEAYQLQVRPTSQSACAWASALAPRCSSLSLTGECCHSVAQKCVHQWPTC